MVRAFLKCVLKITTLLFFRVKVVGKENIEEDKPYIICPTHTSNWDPVTLFSFLKRKDIYFLAKEEIFANTFIKLIANKVHALPVKRGKQDTGLLKNCAKLLKESHIVLIFPEGTRNGIKKNGKIQNGAVLMSLMSGASIIPIGIQATYKPFISRAIINIGKPMSFNEYKENRGDKETLNMLSKKVMDEMVRLTNEKI